MSDLLTRLFFGGFVRLHVLYHAVKEPIFGVEMMEELRRHGYDVGPGTLYPMLQKLEQAGFLTCHTEVVGGKRRKYYRATPEGARAFQRDLPEAELHLLDTGHFALEEELGTIAGLMKDFYARRVGGATSPGVRAAAMFTLASVQRNQPVITRRSFRALASCSASKASSRVQGSARPSSCVRRRLKGRAQ